MQTKQIERGLILDALERFARQRPGLEIGNYADWSSYRAEARRIARDLRDVVTFLRDVRLRDMTIDADALKAALREAFSGRLSWDGERLDYCTGQYFPTEYRRAVAAVLARALWNAIRECNPKLNGIELRARMRREFGRGIASRYFN